MKKLFLLCCLSLAILGACTKKNISPTYLDFTPISGQFTVSDLGRYRPTKQDTTAVLSNLQLRIVSNQSSTVDDVYEFKGALNTRESILIQFFAPKNRTGNGPWSGLPMNTTTYTDGKTASAGFAQAVGILSANGNSFTASYDFSGQHGVLK